MINKREEPYLTSYTQHVSSNPCTSQPIESKPIVSFLLCCFLCLTTNYNIFSCVSIIVLLFHVCFKCLLNAENKLICASPSGNMYIQINGAGLLSIPHNPMLSSDRLLQKVSRCNAILWDWLIEISRWEGRKAIH